MNETQTKEQADKFAEFLLSLEEPQLRCNAGEEWYAKKIVKLCAKDIPIVVDHECPNGRIFCVDLSKMPRNDVIPFHHWIEGIYNDPTVPA